MKRTLVDIFILLMNIIVFFTLVQIIWNMGIYADEHNTSLSSLLGNSTFVYALWISIIFSFLFIIISFYNIFKNIKAYEN